MEINYTDFQVIKDKFLEDEIVVLKDFFSQKSLKKLKNDKYSHRFPVE